MISTSRISTSTSTLISTSILVSLFFLFLLFASPLSAQSSNQSNSLFFSDFREENAEQEFLSSLTRERRERKLSPSTSPEDNRFLTRDIQGYKPLLSSTNGQWLLISETKKTKNSYHKRLLLYDNERATVTETTHENPVDFYAALDRLQETYGLSISLEREQIPGTNHLMSQLPIHLYTEALPMRPYANAQTGRGSATRASHVWKNTRASGRFDQVNDFYVFSIQLGARNNRYQAAVLQLDNRLSEPPMLREVWYSPLSYAMVFVIRYRYTHNSVIQTAETLVFCNTLSVILTDTFEVLRANEYRPSEEQEKTIFQKIIAPNPYTQQLRVAFYFHSGQRLEYLFAPEAEPILRTVQTAAGLEDLLALSVSP